MDVKELTERYKAMPRRNRMIGMVCAGVLFPVYTYFNDLPPLEEQLVAVQGELGEAQRKFEKVDKERKNLPKLEEELKFVQDQLKRAKALLPERIHIEDVLQKTASIARETRVMLRDFTPGNEREVSGDYRYAEIPISLSISGGFVNLMGFYDRLVHLGSNVRLRGLTFSPQRVMAGSGSTAPDIEAKVTMVYFRSTDTGEAPAPKAEPPKAKFKPKSGGEGGGAADGD
jgi:Tfp pilus assembly protein PilO